MASIQKFTDNAVSHMLAHNNRTREEYANTDIDINQSFLNENFPLNHGNLSDFEYYQKLIGEKYLYGRGTSREKDAITACGWVVTCPKEIAGNPEKETAFFKGVFDFISNRYGSENILNVAIHYDELSPHIHVMFCPVTKLDHDMVHFKTVKTKQAVKLESGRYEYVHKFVLKDGEKIKLKNYSKMSDYYDEKISANDVLNKIELKHFHNDLQDYLTANGIEGTVVNGKTGGINISVKELKEFTKNTGLHLDEVREIQTENTILESLVERNSKVQELEHTLTEKEKVIKQLNQDIADKEITHSADKTELIHKEKQIEQLSSKLSAKEQELIISTEKNSDLEKKLAEKEQELKKAKERIQELEKEQTVNTQKNVEQSWGTSSSWGTQSQAGWGNNTTNKEVTHTW